MVLEIASVDYSYGVWFPCGKQNGRFQNALVGLTHRCTFRTLVLKVGLHQHPGVRPDHSTWTPSRTVVLATGSHSRAATETTQRELMSPPMRNAASVFSSEAAFLFWRVLIMSRRDI